MKAVFFRFLDTNGTPTGYVGLAAGINDLELFWQIAEYGSPYLCQIKSIGLSGGFCVKEKWHNEEEMEYEEIEVSSRLPLIGEDGWKFPKWTLDKLTPPSVKI